MNRKKSTCSLSGRQDKLAYSLVLLAALAASGCGSVSTRFVTGLSAGEIAAAENLPVHEGTLAEGTYRRIGEVRGLSCQTSSKSAYRASKEDALSELRRATVRDGGNAVMNVRCLEQGLDQSRSACFEGFECHGTAVTLNRPGTE